MANLKEIRIRITSVESTKQITSAMKLVAAAKLRKAQDAIVMMRPYAAKMHEILQNLSAGSELAAENTFVKPREVEKVLIVAIASNRGLCGAFNANVNKKVLRLLNTDFAAQHRAGNAHILTIGKKSTEFFDKAEYPLVEHHDKLWDGLNWEEAQKLISRILDKYRNGDYDRVVLVYNQFKNAATQVLSIENFLPVEPTESVAETQNDYLMEPSREVIVDELIPKSLKVQFYKALLDSFAAEHGARMTAMHKATDNATEMIKDLKLTYNKARQAAITNEIIEIVSGANAL